MIYLARKDQDLESHIQNTANLAKKFASVFGVPNTAYVAGLLHDFGKYTIAFQNYLELSLKGKDIRRGSVIHSLQGAKFITDAIKNPVISDIISNPIATHHGGLFDNLSDGERTLYSKIRKYENKLDYEEAKKAFNPDIDETSLEKEILSFCHKCKSKGINPYFMLHLLTKTIYSCLVDADRSDAAGLEIKDQYFDWDRLMSILENYLNYYPVAKKIDEVRNNISEQCLKAGAREQGIYTLCVPTGGGKTLSSLRFALEHAKIHKLKRIIYVIPYLSILDQTASKLREVLRDDSDDLILEHHSNIEPSEDDEDNNQYRLLASRWDNPIILTTMVQFLETIYSNKASKLRKFHNMSESVLIFDEIQSLPIKCVHLFNSAVNFLRVFGKSTILLCSATQPHLHKTEKPILLSDEPNIVRILPEEFEIFERVKIQDNTKPAMDHEQIAELAKSQIEQGKSVLVILNTKDDARKLYEKSKYIECEKAFLTTNLCPAHRLRVLDRLRNNLSSKNKKTTLCVSTQLIEAGVDISFECVIRAEAGMDSIIQAAGRCNRNKENPIPQTVFIVNVKDEKLSLLPEIKEGKAITSRVLHENQGRNLLSEKVVEQYYDYYFYDQQKGDNTGKMDYKIKNRKTTVYSLLSDNQLETAAYKNRNKENFIGLPCAFQTAADEFSVIDGKQTGIVVPYEDASDLVNKFIESHDPKQKMRILKQLQKYTVSVYTNVLNELEQKQRALVKIENTFYFLAKDYYDSEEQGLKLEAMLSLLYE